MLNNGIELNFDVKASALINGKIESILEGKSTDYVTKVGIVLPSKYLDIPKGNFNIEYKNEMITIESKFLNKVEDDFLLKICKDNEEKTFLRLKETTGLNISNILPFEAFSNNRGIYPTSMVIIYFNRRIATWIDGNTPTKLKLDIETMKVMGAPTNNEKLLAILILNKWLNSLNNRFDALNYESINIFIETYFKKPYKEPVLSKTHLISSNDAFKNIIYEYLLPKLQESGVKDSYLNFTSHKKEVKITNDYELKKVVEECIIDILKYNIEYRRWIEPFWDGKRKIKYNGEKIDIPNMPKREPKIQPTLHVLLDLALSSLGIHVVRESDEGIGALDFKFLYTTKESIPLSVAVEFKLAHHNGLEHGIETQLPAYLNAIKSKNGIFVVMWFKDGVFFQKPKNKTKEEMEQTLLKKAKVISKKYGIDLSSILIDASIRPSASNI